MRENVLNGLKNSLETMAYFSKAVYLNVKQNKANCVLKLTIHKIYRTLKYDVNLYECDLFKKYF